LTEKENQLYKNFISLSPKELSKNTTPETAFLYLWLWESAVTCH